MPRPIGKKEGPLGRMKVNIPKLFISSCQKLDLLSTDGKYLVGVILLPFFKLNMYV